MLCVLLFLCDFFIRLKYFDWVLSYDPVNDVGIIGTASANFVEFRGI